MWPRVFLLPALLWLLMPSGICICYLPETILAHLSGGRLCNYPAPESPDDPHPPGCTMKKLPVVAEHAPDLPQLQASPVLFACLPTDTPLSVTSPGSAVPCPRGGGSDPPIYLTALSLRI
jgi:hypothetical protein